MCWSFVNNIPPKIIAIFYNACMKALNKLKLNSGYEIPSIGLGTWRSKADSVMEAVKCAILEAKYRHVDCAAVYGNEKEIGLAFNEIFKTDKVKREDVFITSKLWNTEHNPTNVESACRKTLSDLQLDYLDLYLIHWGIAFEHGNEIEPMGKDGIVKTAKIPIKDTWQAMEKLVEKGLVKSIGVANFTAPMLLDILTYARIPPAVNQIEIHPYNTQDKLVEFCQKKNILVTAYSPFGSAGDPKEKPLFDPIIQNLAEVHNVSPGQVLVKWAVSRGIAVLPKSTRKDRILTNIDINGFELTELDMDRISALNKNHRYVNPIIWWGIPYFS